MMENLDIMHDIILFATAHSELGFCNSNELLKIIEQISPDLIFEEKSPESYTRVHSGIQHDSLESYSIKKYLKKYPIPIIPVDLDIHKLIDRQLHKNIVEMFEVINNHPEYEQLTIQREKSINQYGFSYVNSDEHRELMERIRALEEKSLKIINHRKLTQVHKTWLGIIDKRENEMVKNIYSYSSINEYERALFLVGAEHRKPIIDKIPKFEKNCKTKLNWKFKYFD